MPPPPEPIARVIARMRAIEEELPSGDGVGRFNRLYLSVTEEVGSDASASGFEDPAALERLDVVFASLYFDAIDVTTAGKQPPHAWAPLFESRASRRVAPLQFALAGMNAHINRDLPVALVTVWAELGAAPGRESAFGRDYRRVNGILERVESRARRELQSELLQAVDEALGRVDDVVAIWKVARAREAAWNHAQTLWALRDLEPLRDHAVETLDRMVELAGRALLIPTL